MNNKDAIPESQQITVRAATPDDVTTILSFIKKKSVFDRQMGAFSGTIQTSEAKIRQTIFGKTPFARVMLAEITENPVGFALYYFRYSSFVGQPSLWLDDLYVDEDSRSQGVGVALMSRLAQVAKENQCTHLAWTADMRNTRGLNFYHQIGATIIEQKGNSCFLKWIPQAAA